MGRRVDVTLPDGILRHLDALDSLYGSTDQDRIRSALRIALPQMATRHAVDLFRDAGLPIPIDSYQGPSPTRIE